MKKPLIIRTPMARTTHKSHLIIFWAKSASLAIHTQAINASEKNRLIKTKNLSFHSFFFTKLSLDSSSFRTWKTLGRM